MHELVDKLKRKRNTELCGRSFTRLGLNPTIRTMTSSAIAPYIRQINSSPKQLTCTSQHLIKLPILHPEEKNNTEEN